MSRSASAIRLDGAVAGLAFEARRLVVALRWPRRCIGRRPGEPLERRNRPAVSGERCRRTLPCPCMGDVRRSAYVLFVRWGKHVAIAHGVILCGFSPIARKILLRERAPVKSAVPGERDTRA